MLRITTFFCLIGITLTTQAQNTLVDSALNALRTTIDIKNPTMSSLKLTGSCRSKQRVAANQHQFLAIISKLKAGFHIEKINYKDSLQKLKAIKVNGEISAFKWEQRAAFVSPERKRKITLYQKGAYLTEQYYIGDYLNKSMYNQSVYLIKK